MKMILSFKAHERCIRIFTDKGVQVFQLAGLTKDQQAGIFERIVDYWCVEHGWKPLYGTL